MSAQLTYTIAQDAAYAGQLYDISFDNIISRAVEGVAGFAFGVAVSRGSNPELQAVVGGTDFLGISIRSLDKEGDANTGAIKWNESEAAGILRTGSIWAVCVDGCTAGDSVKYVNATGALTSGAAAAGETQLDGAKWDTTIAAGGIAVINLQNSNTTAGA